MSEHWGGYDPGDGPLRDDIAELTEKIAERDAEIERLRDAAVIARTTNANLHSEIERLRGHVELLLENDGKAQAEIERLRELLREGIKAIDVSGADDDEVFAAHWPKRVREALGDER